MIKGYRNPTIGDTSGTWTGAGNTFASDGSDASIVANATASLRAKGFQLNIPDNAIIRGVEVSIEGEGNNATQANRDLTVSLTFDGTVAVGTAKTFSLPQTTDAVVVGGGAADLWGIAQEIDVDAANATTFGVHVVKTTATGTVNLDHVVLRVYYDAGIAGEWERDFTNERLTHLDYYLDYDGGVGGTAPVVGDVVRNTTAAAPKPVARVVRLAGWNVLAFGTLALGEGHGSLDWADNDGIEIVDFVDFDAETGGGISEVDIGKAFLASVGSTRTGTIEHVESSGTTGRLWFTQTGGTAIANNSVITVTGTSRTVVASAAETTNAWTSAANGAEKSQGRFYLDYDAETTKFEATAALGSIRDTLGFALNMCVMDATSFATAMLVDDRETQGATDQGRFYLTDKDAGTFGDNNVIQALTEIDYTAELADGFLQMIGEAGELQGVTSSATATVRRVVTRTGGAGTIYVSGVTGGPFTAGEVLRKLTGAINRGTMSGAQRDRVGSAAINGTVTSPTYFQFPTGHLYSDNQDLFDDLLQGDNDVPMSADVKNQGYKTSDGWLLPFFSRRWLKTGALSQLGANNDNMVDTNYQHLGSFNSSNGVPNAYVEQADAESAKLVHERFWDPGSFNLLFRNKNKALSISSGLATWFVRNFRDEYDHAEVSDIGLAVKVGLNTKDDGNNNSTYATVRDGAAFQDIRLIFASHLITFDGGSGTAPAVSQVVFNTTKLEAAMVCRTPTSAVSGADLHVGSSGVNVADWADNETLDLLDAHEFDGQASQFVVGEAIENQTDAWNATVRFVQQRGNSRGRIWVSGVTGTLADNDTIRLNGAGATRATAAGAVVTAGNWTALTNGATPVVADNTVLRDTGAGGEQPYSVVIDAGGATIPNLYELFKFVCEERAGSTTDPGSRLYPNNAAIDGRLYQKADSAYAASTVVKVSPLGTKAGTKLFGARGVFVFGVAGADAQNFQLKDANGVDRFPPNTQTITYTGHAVGNSIIGIERTGSALNKNDYNISALAGDHNGTGDTILQIDEALPSHTPSSGTIIVQDTGGNGELALGYSAILSSGIPARLTLSAALGFDLKAADKAYIPLVYKAAGSTTETQSLVYSADIPFAAIRRKKGTKPDRVDTTFSANGSSVQFVKGADTNVE